MNNTYRHIIDLFKINKKGQADTVFEVLIAVILLGFVLFAGTYAMSSLSNTKCSKSIDISISDLRLTIEKAASSTLISTDFLFNMPYCFGNEYTLVLEKQANAALCSSYCPGSSGSCYLLHYKNPKDKVSQVRYSCVQISPIVRINDSSSNCSMPSDASGIYSPYSDKFDNGRYIITSKNLSTTNTFPGLCIFKKESE